jgi:hypothetical protein
VQWVQVLPALVLAVGPILHPGQNHLAFTKPATYFNHASIIGWLHEILLDALDVSGLTVFLPG